MRQGRLVPFPTLRERPRKTAALQRRFARALRTRRPSPRLVKALQLLYALACILVVVISLATIAGLP
ncbi:hypothetical protein ACFODL_05190 [Phenylobacterium terrae]|uniref:Uncharacterized protein n=1 Tax=Phenylobacterium terrae TaxID=2665495 RepID=A0ABW4MXB4_9CAUL